MRRMFPNMEVILVRIRKLATRNFTTFFFRNKVIKTRPILTLTISIMLDMRIRRRWWDGNYM